MCKCVSTRMHFSDLHDFFFKKRKEIPESSKDSLMLGLEDLHSSLQVQIKLFLQLIYRFNSKI